MNTECQEPVEPPTNKSGPGLGRFFFFAPGSDRWPHEPWAQLPAVEGSRAWTPASRTAGCLLVSIYPSEKGHRFRNAEKVDHLRTPPSGNGLKRHPLLAAYQQPVQKPFLYPRGLTIAARQPMGKALSLFTCARNKINVQSRGTSTKRPNQTRKKDQRSAFGRKCFHRGWQSSKTPIVRFRGWKEGKYQAF